MNAPDTAGPESARLAFAHRLRAIACLAVIGGHFLGVFGAFPQLVADLVRRPAAVDMSLAPSIVNRFVDWAQFGVGLFFLISGFVIPFSLARLSAPGFLVARLMRLHPLYVAGLTLTIACIAINAALSDTPALLDMRRVLISYSIVLRWPSWTPSIDGVVWTLEIEYAFYAICACAAGTIRRGRLAVLAIGPLAAAAAIVVAATGASDLTMPLRLYALLHWSTAMAQFVTFMLIGTVFHLHHRGAVGAGMAALLQAGLFACFAIASRAGLSQLTIIGHLTAYALAWLTFTAAYALRAHDAAWPRWLDRPLTYVADVSYPLYVVHGVIGYSVMMAALDARLPPALAPLLGFAVVLALAALLHRLVEEPCRSIGRRLGQRLSERAGRRRANARQRVGTGFSPE